MTTKESGPADLMEFSKKALPMSIPGLVIVLIYLYGMLGDSLVFLLIAVAIIMSTILPIIFLLLFYPKMKERIQDEIEEELLEEKLGIEKDEKDDSYQG